MKKKITDEQILGLMQTCDSMKEVAEKLGISRSVLYKKVNKESFQKLQTEQKAESFRRIADKLTSASGKAIDTLLMVLNDEESPPNAKVRSAETILAYSLKYRVSVDFEDRLKKLEELAESDK